MKDNLSLSQSLNKYNIDTNSGKNIEKHTHEKERRHIGFSGSLGGTAIACRKAPDMYIMPNQGLNLELQRIGMQGWHFGDLPFFEKTAAARDLDSWQSCWSSEVMLSHPCLLRLGRYRPCGGCCTFGQRHCDGGGSVSTGIRSEGNTKWIKMA